MSSLINFQRKCIAVKLNELVEQKGAHGFQLALGFKQHTLGVFSAGFRDDQAKSKMTVRTWFDLASLTKIISTVDSLMMALQEKKIQNLEEPVSKYLPQLPACCKDKTFLDFLEHKTGLSPLFEDTKFFHSREERVQCFLSSLKDIPHTSPLPTYSDVGFIILGLCLENIYQKRLRELFGKREQLQFGPLSRKKFFSFRGKNVAALLSLDQPPQVLEGVVQDPRAQWLEGDAGHAGLFGTALGVELWGKDLYMNYHGKGLRFSDKVVRSFISFDRSFVSVSDCSVRECQFIGGFDTPTKPPTLSQAGSRAGSHTIGHLGYTGTSFWIDIEKGFRITLLSHRFSPGIDPLRLNRLRPSFHDWLHEEIFSRLEI